MVVNQDDVRTVSACDKIQAECRRGRTSLNCWMWGVVFTLAIVLTGTLTGFAVAQAAKDATQDSRIASLEKNQDRVINKLDRIEELVREILGKGNKDHGG